MLRPTLLAAIALFSAAAVVFVVVGVGSPVSSLAADTCVARAQNFTGASAHALYVAFLRSGAPQTPGSGVALQAYAVDALDCYAGNGYADGEKRYDCSPLARTDATASIFTEALRKAGVRNDSTTGAWEHFRAADLRCSARESGVGLPGFPAFDCSLTAIWQRDCE